MARKFFCFLAIAGLVVWGAQAPAQPPAKPTVTAISPAVKAKLDPAVLKLSAIEGRLKTIETRKVITVEDADQMGDTMYKYAEEMYAAFEAAMKEAETYAKSEGKEGSIQSLVQFEKTAKAHENKLKQLEPRFQALDKNIRAGVVMYDRPLLEKMEKSDLQEFIKSLSPPARQKYQKRDPMIFQKLGPMSDLEEPQKEAVTWKVPSVRSLSHLLVSPAEARIAAGCIGDCLARNWSACASCLASKGPQARECWNTFVSRWKDCGKCWKPSTWWCKVKALGKLIACIA